jgi:hypothetical protein
MKKNTNSSSRVRLIAAVTSLASVLLAGGAGFTIGGK